MEIGELINQKRKEKKLTLEEVGNLVGVGKSTVRKWEKGMIENIGRDNIVKLSKALDISPLSLLGIIEKENNNQSSSDLIPLDKKLGNRVKQYREEKGVSQELLVKTLGISLNDLKSYETGQKPFTVNTVFHFADALGVTFDDLFPNTTTEYFNEIPAILYLDEENNTIITTKGKKYVVSDKEMQQAKDFLTFLHRK